MKVLFLKKMILFLFIFLVSLNVVCYLMINSNAHVGFIENGQIYYAITKSKIKHPDSEVFVLGGSVADQMYNNRMYNDRINSLCTVFPVTMSGQYLLLMKLIENNDLKGRKVYLISHPNGFMAAYNEASIFHYLLKPFYNSDFSGHFDNKLKLLIDQQPFREFARLPMIKVSNWSPSFQQLDLSTHNQGMSDNSIHYLKKMDSLSSVYGFEFVVLPSILSDSYKDVGFKELKETINHHQLSNRFKKYFESMLFMDEKHFSDGYHISDLSLIPVNPMHF